MQKRKRKALVLQGGGIFGCIELYYLSLLPKDWLKDIDYIGGSSIGGILSALLASGKSPGVLLSSFPRLAESIFQKRLWAKLSPLACPTYGSEGIEKVLQAYLSDMNFYNLKQLNPHLDIVLAAQNITTDDYKVWDSIIEDTDYDLPVRLMAQAGAAAPTFFPGVVINNDIYADTGIIDNCFVMTMAGALKDKAQLQLDEFDIFCLGSGQYVSEKSVTPKRYESFNKLEMVTNVIAPYMVTSNECATRFWCRQFGVSATFFNPVKTSGEMDDVKSILKWVKAAQYYKDDFVVEWDIFLNK